MRTIVFSFLPLSCFSSLAYPHNENLAMFKNKASEDAKTTLRKAHSREYKIASYTLILYILMTNAIKNSLSHLSFSLRRGEALFAWLQVCWGSFDKHTYGSLAVFSPWVTNLSRFTGDFPGFIVRHSKSYIPGTCLSFGQMETVSHSVSCLWSAKVGATVQELKVSWACQRLQVFSLYLEKPRIHTINVK